MTVIVSGKTYDLRARLYDIGGRFNTTLKHWEFHSLSPEHRDELNSHVGVMISESSKEIIPPFQPARKHIELDDYVLDQIERTLGNQALNRRYNFFGDDRSWINYFADQNPITFFGFSSLQSMIRYIEALPKNKENVGYEIDDPEWAGTPDMRTALALARNGWPEGVDMAQEIISSLVGQHAKERRRKYSVAGGSVNVGRMLADNPNHMVSRPKQPGKKIITFFVECGMSSSIDAGHMTIRAATTAAIVDVLEINGYSCEIVSITTARNYSKPAYQIATTLKSAGEPLNLNDIVFAMGHPSYLRRLVFACNGSDSALQDIWFSMGQPSDAFTKSHPTKSNEHFICGIEHGSNIDDHAPLLTKAMQIWDLVVDKQLPITLNREGIEDDEIS